MEEQKFDMKGPVIKYGIILALIGIIITTLIYIVDETMMIKWWFGLISLAINLALLIYFGISIRNENGGFMKFKTAFSLVFLIVFFAMLISSAYSLVLHTVIDPDLGSRLTEAMIEQQTQILERFSVPEEQMDEAIKQLREQDSFSVPSLLKSSGIASVIGALIMGLIVGAIIKKKVPEPDMM
jgi:hypothetical protein